MRARFLGNQHLGDGHIHALLFVVHRTCLCNIHGQPRGQSIELGIVLEFRVVQDKTIRVESRDIQAEVSDFRIGRHVEMNGHDHGLAHIAGRVRERDCQVELVCGAGLEYRDLHGVGAIGSVVHNHRYGRQGDCAGRFGQERIIHDQTLGLRDCSSTVYLTNAGLRDIASART